ncbi:Presequence protease, mitochondrial [Halocaridina rubra]|uniref:Presequence protease, mitochondrial n=1 Tax=Halocaridina rubra TaxID=373956 RepID=A0AAN8WZA5_HALRR
MTLSRLIKNLETTVIRRTWTESIKNINKSFNRRLPFATVANSVESTPVISAASEAVKTHFPVGSKISGFLVKEVSDIRELHLTAVRLEHVATGADYLHIARDDSNNVFCVGFRTTPMDSTGVPHILEHTVLCGSNKYPCRDPFMKMLNRSLSTFMNAMTGSDFTIYPFSSQHPVDFRNLMSVYLDAVFNPKLTEYDFLQEGWRLEHEDVNNPSSPLVFKGVVFNEMKGVFADSQQLFSQKLQNGVLPSHTYGVVYGGDPLCIPDLTWEQLKNFHAYHYHPSNARFYTYGDQPLVDHLAFIQDNYLSKFTKIDPKTSVPEEPTWSEPRCAHISCGGDPIGGSDQQTSLAVVYKLVNINDIFENFVLQLLGLLLTSGPNAPFYESLMEPQFGSSFSPFAGYNGHTRNTTFAIGLQGMKEEDVDRVKSAIDDTFKGLAETGFPSERIEAILHSIELSLKHQSSSFGLGLAMALAPLWNLDTDPVDALQINRNIEHFRKCLAENPNFLQEKIKKYFISNKHKFTLTMSPQSNYEAQLLEAENLLLQTRVTSLSDNDKAKIWEQGQTLRQKQDVEEDISCLPTFKVSDISRNITSTLVKDLSLSGGVPVQICNQPTNGITYFSAVLDTKSIPGHLQPLIPLLCSVLTRMGAGQMNFRTLDQEIELKTGGLHVATHVTPHPVDVSLYEQGVHISSHCLNKKLTDMLDLWSLIFNEVKFDDLQRFSTLVKMTATEQANSLVFHGHRYAMTSSTACTSYVGSLAENWSGLTALKHLKQWSEMEDLAPVLEQLRDLAKLLLSKQYMRVAVNTTDEYHDKSLNTFERFFNQLNGTPKQHSPVTSIPSDFTSHTLRCHQVFPFPVNFASKAYAGVSYAHPDSGALRVLARMMFKFLHREIREKGGAYGGGAMSNPGGAFAFYSYRDPNSTQTLTKFDDAVEWVLSGKFSERDVDEAKLGVFQSVDAPVAPSSKGKRCFLLHISDELFADHRRCILDATPQDLVRVARVYLRDAAVEGACLIGPQNEDLEKDPFWSVVTN